MIRRKINRFTRYAQMACLCSVFISVTCCADSKNSQTINSFFKKATLGGASRNYDLRTVIPAEWERVCIGYFPYASQAHIEEKFRGKVLGKYKVVGDSNWMLLGINAKNEITQVVLDVDVSIFLSKNFRSTRTGHVDCVYREQAILTPTINNGKQYIKFGNL